MKDVAKAWLLEHGLASFLLQITQALDEAARERIGNPRAGREWHTYQLALGRLLTRAEKADMYRRDGESQGESYPDPGPGPHCCYCQFGADHGLLTTVGERLEDTYHPACRKAAQEGERDGGGTDLELDAGDAGGAAPAD